LLREEEALDITVVIPVYNAEASIDRCVQSAICQKQVNFEVLCIDNGSIDKSVERIKCLCEQHSKIKLLFEASRGSAFARNRGIIEAKGEFIAFLDADDYYPSDTVLSSLVNFARANNANICGGELATCGDTKDFFLQFAFERYGLSSEGRFIEYSDFQEDYFFQRYVYSRSFLIDNNILFPNYLRFQDPPFFVRAMTVSERFFAVPLVSYCYRVAEKNIQWTNEKVEDLVSGMVEVLRLSSSHSFEKIHRHIFNLFNYEPNVAKPIKEALFAWDTKLPPLLVDAIEATDVNLLEKVGVYLGDWHFFSKLSSFMYDVCAADEKNHGTEQLCNWRNMAELISHAWDKKLA
jgi:glycosyltransferase involved in cell wall biosynthesis